MLALARKKGETIMIGDDIEIAVLNIHNDFVRIGINAPKNIPVHRKEIYEQIQEENKNAAKLDKGSVPKLNSLFKEKK